MRELPNNQESHQIIITNQTGSNGSSFSGLSVCVVVVGS
jgi:hypothetical protein